MEKKKKKSDLHDNILGMAQAEHIQRYGEAASQMIQANKGVRYDVDGNDLGHKGRSLLGISEYKLNSDSQERIRNIKQQAGFSAELIEEARENKRKILVGSSNRVRTTDGLGQTNHQQYDHVELDEKGYIISGSGSQMKFLGVDKKGKYAVVENIVKKDSYSKYDTKIEVPKDQYDGAMKYANKQAENYQKQADKLKKNGDFVKAEQKEEIAEKYRQVPERLKKSNLTLEEAQHARLNPNEFTTKEVIHDSLEAGVQAMAAAAMISGIISIAQNMVAVISGDKNIEVAVTDTLKTTAGASVSALFIGTTGTALKAAMHTSEIQFVRCLGTTSGPTIIATSLFNLSKGIVKYAKGDITTEELFLELSEKSVCSLAAGLGSGFGGHAGGNIAVAIAGNGSKSIGSIIGGITGGMVTYTLCSALYSNITGALKEEKIAHERRVYLEQLCDTAIQKMNEYQEILCEYRMNIMKNNQKEFDRFFDEIDLAIVSDDIDGIFGSFNNLGNQYGVKTQFLNYNEFDSFMKDENSVLRL